MLVIKQPSQADKRNIIIELESTVLKLKCYREASITRKSPNYVWFKLF